MQHDMAVLWNASSCGDVKWTIATRRWWRRRRRWRWQTRRKGFINIIPPPPANTSPPQPSPSAISGGTAASSTLSRLTIFLTTMSSPDLIIINSVTIYNNPSRVNVSHRVYPRLVYRTTTTTYYYYRMGPLLLSLLATRRCQRISCSAAVNCISASCPLAQTTHHCYQLPIHQQPHTTILIQLYNNNYDRPMHGLRAAVNE